LDGARQALLGDIRMASAAARYRIA